MRPELTNELKARFAAQYIGANIYAYCDNNPKGKLTGVSSDAYLNTYSIDAGTEENPDTFPYMDCTLVLRPLSSISDEEAIEIVGGLLFEDNQKQVLKRCRRLLNKWCRDQAPLILMPVDTYQKLQSRGFALPFMGYSVEELIEAGWIKLQEEKA